MENKSNGSDVTVTETTSLVTVVNNRLITTSRKVAEQFDKNHAHVMRDIRDIIVQIGDESKIGSMFNETIYVDKYGREKPMYEMTRDGFSLLAMGFTGKKALEFKLKFINAFNLMEKMLEQQAVQSQQPTVLTPLEILKQQVAVMEDLDRRTKQNEEDISSVKEEVSIAQKDIVDLRKAHNGMFWFRQQQYTQQQADINSLRQDITELQEQNSDISTEIDIFVSRMAMSPYFLQKVDPNERYQAVWRDFYNAIAREASKPEGYIQGMVTRQRNNLIKNGVSKTSAEKRVTGKTVIKDNPELVKAARSVMARVNKAVDNKNG